MSKVAVIVVPGIGGSNIADAKASGLSPDGFGADLTSTMLGKHAINTAEGVRAMLLKAAGWVPLVIPSSVPELTTQRGWKQVANSVYHAFLDDCQKQTGLKFQPEVYAIGYNFTQSNSRSADTVITRTRSIMDDESLEGYIYVTHSMGSLPARSALQKMQGTPLYRKCIGVLHVAAPNAGANELFRRFLFGVEGDALTSYILGNTGKAFATSACVIPSMCELLPRASLDMEPGLRDGVAQVLKDSPVREANLESLEANIDNARQFLDQVGDYSHERSIALVLGGFDTIADVTLSGQSATSVTFKFTKSDGDETVTADSQKAGARAAEEVSGMKHADPLTNAGKATVFPKIYELLSFLYERKDYELLR
jgi:hypothetical protein